MPMTQTADVANDYEAVVERYANMVYRLAYAIVRSKSDADDVFQEVFLRYFRFTPGFESEEHQKAWLIRVTGNCANKLLTSAWRRKRAALSDEIPFAAPEETGLGEALAQLPPLYRNVIHLFYYEGYQAEEIAKLLHRKPGTVRTQLVRARQLLARQLQKEASHV